MRGQGLGESVPSCMKVVYLAPNGDGVGGGGGGGTENTVGLIIKR